MKLKVNIWPSFINTSLFELKEEEGEWTLFVTKESYDHLKDQGFIWTKKQVDGALPARITALAQSIIDAPTPDERVMLDGVSVKLKLTAEGKEYEAKFSSPIAGSKEFRFVEDLLSLSKAAVSDAACQDYLELLDQYFFDVIPIKEFNEDVYRLKVYGGLSISELDALSEKIALLKERPKGVLDLTNFLGAGYALSSCFLELKEAKHIEIHVNTMACNFLTEIGFDKSRLALKN